MFIIQSPRPKSRVLLTKWIAMRSKAWLFFHLLNCSTTADGSIVTASLEIRKQYYITIEGIYESSCTCKTFQTLCWTDRHTSCSNASCAAQHQVHGSWQVFQRSSSDPYWHQVFLKCFKTLTEKLWSIELVILPFSIGSSGQNTTFVWKLKSQQDLGQKCSTWKDFWLKIKISLPPSPTVSVCCG